MDTRFVETFLMAVDHHSIAEAARRLNITPAAAAKRIRTLEAEVDAVLVRRSGRTIKPTEAGAALVERAKRFLSEAPRFQGDRSDRSTIGSIASGSISIGLDWAAAGHSGFAGESVSADRCTHQPRHVSTTVPPSARWRRSRRGHYRASPFCRAEEFRLATASRGVFDCTDESASAFSKAACDFGIRTVHSLGSQRLGRPPHRRLPSQG